MLKELRIHNEKLQSKLIHFSRWIFGIVLLFSIEVLAEWSFDYNIIRKPIAFSVSTNPLSAICFALSCIAFFQYKSKLKLNIPATIILLMVFLVGILKLASISSLIDFEIDTLLFTEKLKLFYPGVRNSMSFFTALGFILVSASLLLLNLKRTRDLSVGPLLALLCGTIGLLFILGYIYKVPEFYQLLSRFPMSLTTATSFLLIASAILLANPRKSFMSRFTTVLAGSLTARVLIPVAVIVPIIIGNLRVFGERQNLYSSNMGIVIMTISIILVFLIFIWYTTGELNRKDYSRLKAEIDLINLNETLEAKVRQRTLELQITNEELAEREEKYRNLYENSLVCIITSDARTLKPILVNDVGVRLFGYKSKAEFIEKFNPVIHSVNPKEGEENIRVANEHGELVNRIQEMKKADGTNFWVELFIKLNSAKNIAESVIVDITPQIEAQNMLARKISELKKAYSEMESINYILSHDMLEPLRKIMSFSNLLQRGNSTDFPPDTDVLTNKIYSTSRHMQEKIEHLGLFMRLKKSSEKIVKIQLQDSLNEAINKLEEKIVHANAEVITGNMCSAEVQPTQITQLFYQLISNSLKFSHPKRRPIIKIDSQYIHIDHFQRINFDKKTLFCNIRVTDNGIGFDNQYKELIFEIFERLHSQDEYPGTGIGLAICKQIVENHSGYITANGAPGQGAQFDIYLPVYKQ